jgi:hypothetical protein
MGIVTTISTGHARRPSSTTTSTTSITAESQERLTPVMNGCIQKDVEVTCEEIEVQVEFPKSAHFRNSSR